MAGGSRKAQDLKAKEAKQKKILIVGLVLFVILMVVQAPKLMHHGGNAAAAPPVPPPTAAPPGATDGSATSLVPPGVGASGGGVAPVTPTGAPASSSSSSGLADSDVAPSPSSGQLIQFDLFASKDPFIQQVKAVGTGGATVPDTSTVPTPTATGPTATTPSGSSLPSGIGAGSTPPSPAGSSGAATPATEAAALMTNGVTEQVRAGRDFPAAAPAFRLVSFTATEAKISVAGGAFQSGAPTIALAKGKSLTLQNTADGSKYVLVYKGSRPATSSPSDPAVTTATAPSTTTPAPATTTTTTSTTTTTPAATTTTASR
jgi:hypothetical protein